MNQDYIRTARSKGLSELTIMRRHVLRNAMLPLTTIVIFSFVGLLEGSFIIEGIMEAWLVGREDQVQILNAGDMIALPADTPHAFRNPGPGELRLLGIHANPERIVHRLDTDG